MNCHAAAGVALVFQPGVMLDDWVMECAKAYVAGRPKEATQAEASGARVIECLGLPTADRVIIRHLAHVALGCVRLVHRAAGYTPNQIAFVAALAATIGNVLMGTAHDGLRHGRGDRGARRN